MSLSADGITSGLYSNYLNTAGVSDSSFTDRDYSKASKEELLEACKEFETYLVEQVFKSMKKMVPKNEEDGKSSSSLDYFNDMLTQEYAKNAVSQGDFGIAQALYEQMKRNYNITD